MRSLRALIAAGAVLALALSTPALASAASDPPPPQQWSDQLAAPFSLAVDGHRVLIADGGTGVIGQLQPDGSIAPVVEGVPGLAGVATRGAWIAYASSEMTGESEPPVITESGLNIRDRKGDVTYADLHAYEVANNPDQVNTYGITDPGSCVASDPRATYTGLVDAHAYNVTAYQGAWLVADAGANTITRVTDDGGISIVAVLPPVPVVITAEIAGMMGLPECAVGDVYNVEPVPTGVAIGPGGAIYVTTLPGFPGEGASQGALWQIDPDTGDATQIVSGLSGPTSIATAANRTYIAELFGAGVSMVKAGELSPFAELPGALAVATAANGTVWVATMASEQGPGTISSIWKGKVKVQGHINR